MSRTLRGAVLLALTLAAVPVPAPAVSLSSVARAAPVREAPSCHGETATIVGTDGADELTGTRGHDVIVGRGGDDRIEALGGSDVVCAGPDGDLVRGGAGDDDIAGGRGGDFAAGGSGADRVRTGRGAVEGLFGGEGDDRLSGGPGSFDGLVGGPGDDVMDGGDGLDTAQFFDSPQGVQVDLRSDSATGHGDDVVIEIEGIVGSNHDDVLDGDDTSNRLVGQQGDDVIRAYGSGTLEDATGDIVSGGSGDDLLDAGAGADVVDFQDARGPVVLDLEEGTSEGEGSDTLAGFEAAIGSDFDDELAGDPGDNALAGGEGDDTLDGRAGTDQAAFFNARAPVVVDLDAGTAEGSGADVLIDVEDVVGSAGDDLLAGDDGANTIVGGSGADVIEGRAGDDVLVGAAGDDRADGGAGLDSCDAEEEASCEADPFTDPSLRAVWGPGILPVRPVRSQLEH